MIQRIQVKSVLNKAKHSDSWFLDGYTINPYSGCSFNCLYCYIRGSKYGEHMEEKVSIKANTLEILEKQLYNRAKKQEYAFVVVGSATDPYLHFEAEEKLTRGILELLLKYRFPAHIVTKSELITRDFDLIEKINSEAILPMHLAHKMNKKAVISFSFSSVDDAVGKIFEPGAPLPSQRLKTLEVSVKNGFLAGVSLMPTIPFVSDTTESLNQMFSAFKKHGAHYAMPSTITLFGNERGDSKTMMFRAIEKHYPHLLEKYKKWFEKSDYMPAFYNNAFNKKMKEMSKEFNLPLRIAE